MRTYADRLIEQYDVRSGQGASTMARYVRRQPAESHYRPGAGQGSGIAEVAVQPTRGLDVGAIEYIHKQLIAQRDAGKAVLLVSLELDEVMNLS